MQTPVAPGWVSLVVYVDGAVVVGAAVVAVVAARRRQGAPAGASLGGLAAAALVGWLGIVLALGSAHAFEARSRGIPWIALGVGAPTVVGFVAFSSPTRCAGSSSRFRRRGCWRCNFPGSWARPSSCCWPSIGFRPSSLGRRAGVTS